MKNILIAILALGVLVLGFFALRPKLVATPIPTSAVENSNGSNPSTTSQSATSPSDQTGVSGMQEYTDKDFGFSFWYPTNWNIRTTNTNPSFGASIVGATVVKRLWLTRAGDSSPSIVIQEAHSTTRTITDTGGAGPIGSVTYYFDPSKHLWMKSNSENGETTPLATANTSNNTMGGLHIFPGTSRFGTSIIPLSADNFVVVGDNGGSMITAALTNTIVALDPSVATPVSAAQQTQTIQAEANQNSSSNQSSQSTATQTAGWKTYTNTKSGFTLQYPSTFDTSLQMAASGDFDGIDTNNIFLVNYPRENFKGTNLYSVTMFVGTKNVDENTCYFTLYGNSTSNETITSPDKTITKNGTVYHVISSSEGAAGSSYTTNRYSTMHDGTCYQLYVVAHSSNNFEAPIIKYDPNIYITPVFNVIVDSFRITK